ncbi:hypothetical protein Tco_0869489 [Tanacetum coccineum]
MKRGFRGAPRPLLPSMLLAATNPIAGQEHAAVAQSQPSSSTPQVQPQAPTPPPIPTPTPPPIPTPKSPPPIPETEPTPDKHIHEEQSPVHHHFSPPQEQQMPVDDLLHEVPTLISRIDSLEMDLKQTKLTMGNAIVKLNGENQDDPPLDSSEQDVLLFYKVNSFRGGTSEDIRPNTLKHQNLSKVPLQSQGLLTKEGDTREENTRIAEEEELNEQQKKRKAQVQFEAQHYTNEDWDLIRAKLEANAELSKSMLGSEVQGEDFAKKMVDLNQGTWKIISARVEFEENKKEFDNIVQQNDSEDSEQDDSVTESIDVYMLIERSYPLSAEMCKAMLDKKLQGGKPDEIAQK